LSVEEFANTVTHGFGLLLSILGFIGLLTIAIVNGGKLLTISFVIYGLSLVILYAASTSYHSTTSPELKRKLQVLDHCGIYLLIAGSFTPFGLLVLGGTTLGTGLLVAIWTLAICGIASKLLLGNRFTAIAVVSYVVMGWLGVLGIQPIFETLGIVAASLAVAGGISYTVGVIFFAWTRLPHSHAIFHVFVLLGSILHYAAVVFYVRPMS
jgi:hemolysin III